MIILEGTDLTGKTILAKMIEQKTGLLYRHLSRLPDTFHRYCGYLPLMHRNFVCDRFFLSELAYVFARNDPKEIQFLSPEYAYLICANLRLMGCVHVVITAEETLLKTRFDKLQQREMYNFQTIVRANEWFDSNDLQQYDVDFHIHLTEEHPWASDQDFQKILKLHAQKLKFLQDLQAPIAASATDTN